MTNLMVVVVLGIVASLLAREPFPDAQWPEPHLLGFASS
jgi:hypothetical protein